MASSTTLFRRVPLESRKIIGNLEPRRLGADEDMLRRPDGRIIDQSADRDVNVGSIAGIAVRVVVGCPAAVRAVAVSRIFKLIGHLVLDRAAEASSRE
jgi:hypothetical protein